VLVANANQKALLLKLQENLPNSSSRDDDDDDNETK
jgi:hypothetical protein